MAVYVGGIKYKFHINGVEYTINSPVSTSITNGIRLLSLDGFTLMDSKGLCMTSEDESKYWAQLLSLDDYALQDLDNLNLIAKKEV